MKNFAMLRKFVKRDYPAFSGFALESFFCKKLEESGEWSRIGNWWDRRGENEIDLIAEDEMSRKAVFAEVKRDGGRISMNALREKASVFMRATGQFQDYTISFQPLSISEAVAKPGRDARPARPRSRGTRDPTRFAVGFAIV